MSHISSGLEDAPVDSAKGQRCLLGHHDLGRFVRHTGAFYRVCLLILMECRSGNILHWIALPFEYGGSIDVQQSFLKFLIVPALHENGTPPTALSMQTDPDIPPSLTPFFAALTHNGGPNIPLGITSTLDDAKLATFFERVEPYRGDPFAQLYTAQDRAEMPTLEELKTTISSFIADWNKQLNRWED